MSFEDFTATCTRTFGQTPVRLVRMSSALSTFAGCLDPPYRHQVLLCQPHFTDTAITIVFYLKGTAYFEYLNEEKIRQRLQLLNNPRRTSFHRGELKPVLTRLKSMLSLEAIKQENANNELQAKLLSARLLSIELRQDDLKFKFRCEERSELFEQHYVRQLLIQVKELSQRQAYLCELLEHKDELPEFDSKLFLSTPMTLVDDPDDNEEDEEILSSSTTSRLWKASFGRRGIQNFLDICLLKKVYMKALDGLDAETTDENATADSAAVEQAQAEDNEDQDEMGFAARIGKRGVLENDNQQLKRVRSDSENAAMSS